MRPQEIQVGKSYVNGKGKVRKVFDFPHIRGKTDIPYVLYTHENGPKKGYVGSCELKGFAKWAVKEVGGEDA